MGNVADPKDPSASPQALSELAEEYLRRLEAEVARSNFDDQAAPAKWSRRFPEEVGVLRAVAEHPNIPPDVAARLMHIAPLEVLRNPALPRYGVSFWQHNWLSFDAERCFKVFAESGADPQLLIPVATHFNPHVRRELALSGVAPIEVFEVLLADSDEGVREAARCLDGVKLSVDNLQRLARFPELANFVSEQLEKALTSRKTSGPELALLAKSTDSSVRRRVARHRNLPPEAAAELLMDRDSMVREEAMKNRAAPKELKDLLARAKRSTYFGPPSERARLKPDVQPPPLPSADEMARLLAGGVYARSLAVAHLDVPEVERLYETGDSSTRLAIAEHARRLPAIESKLARDPDPEVRKMFAARTCSIEHLERLASDSEKWIRVAVLLNPAAPESLLERLSENDADAGVRKQAATEFERRRAAKPE